MDKKLPKLKELNWSWSNKEGIKSWEKDLEKSYQVFILKHPSFKAVPCSGMIFKLIWVECLKFYSK